MWVSVHCWSVVPADGHTSCTSKLPVSFCSISGHACEGKDMHRPRTSHKQQQQHTASGRGVGLQQNIGAPHPVHAHHAHMHACTHARMHARMHARTHAHTHTHARTHARTHTITELTLPLSNGEHLCIMATML